MWDLSIDTKKTYHEISWDYPFKVQVGVEFLTSKIRHENYDKFKYGLSKKGVEYF
jgi:hypothetical protein